MCRTSVRNVAPFRVVDYRQASRRRRQVRLNAELGNFARSLGIERLFPRHDRWDCLQEFTVSSAVPNRSRQSTSRGSAVRESLEIISTHGSVLHHLPGNNRLWFAHFFTIALREAMSAGVLRQGQYVCACHCGRRRSQAAANFGICFSFDTLIEQRTPGSAHVGARGEPSGISVSRGARLLRRLLPVVKPDKAVQQMPPNQGK